MKKVISNMVVSGLVLGLLGACSSEEMDVVDEMSTVSSSLGMAPVTTFSENPVELDVMTSYGVSDGYQQAYQLAYERFERESGHTVIDSSESVSDAWKQKVLSGFQTGAEPDVLFYYTGVDADPLVAAERVVSLEEIRQLYPTYGKNMKEEMLPVSTYDGEAYALPVNGYWQGLFVNTKVLEAAGVDFPDENYTWTQFLEDCHKIQEAGYVPISAALGEKPHYWFEYLVFNRGNLENHLDLPTSSGDEATYKWALALDDLKGLYLAGYFPENTLDGTWEEITQLFLEDQAAFLLDGSWLVNWLDYYVASNYIRVSYFPSSGSRSSTEVIGGISMGYYITRGAWEQPEIQEAAVDFITAMTTNSVVNQFGVSSLTALEKGGNLPTGISSLETSAVGMKESVTGLVEAVQDTLTLEQRMSLFSGIRSVLEESRTAYDVVLDSLDLEYEPNLEYDDDVYQEENDIF